MFLCILNISLHIETISKAQEVPSNKVNASFVIVYPVLEEIHLIMYHIHWDKIQILKNVIEECK